MNKKITCFLSYSHCNENERKYTNIKEILTKSNNYVNYSENKDKSAFSNETIWNHLHDRICGSSCTIVLLTKDLVTYNKHKIEYKLYDFLNSGWVYNEISASLRDWNNNRINGIVCVYDDALLESIEVIFPIENTIYGKYRYGIPEYQIPEIITENKDYIVFASYSNFIWNHQYYIKEAYKRREDQIKSMGNEYKIVYDLHNAKKYWF